MAKQRIVVVTSSGLTPAQLDEVRAVVPGAELVEATDHSLSQLCEGVDAIVGGPRSAFTEELLRKAGPRFRWLHIGGAGVDEFLPAFSGTPVMLTNGRTLQGPGIADHAMALLLALTRNIHLVAGGADPRHMPRPIELRGKTALVIGVGGAGMLIAERAKAFGMRVVGVDARPVPLTAALDHLCLPDELGDILPQADTVLISAPLTPRTRKILGEAEFQRMKRGAILVNVARGGLVDTAALTEALRSGRLGAAGLDVTDPEPLPTDHPLRKMPNVLITPHIAGPSDHNRQRAFELARENIRRFVHGEPLLNVVDKEQGF